MILFPATVALSAFLLFLVQPLIAKLILPWFGGSAAVWTTCLVFFQCLLLAGYLYADTLIRHVRPRTAPWVHLVLLVVSFSVLPIIPSEVFKPTGDAEPTTGVLLLLAATVGLPFLALSATGPLMQAWFARVHPGRRVYRLYALSNVASMAALLLYPPVIERAAGVTVQAWAWSVGYVVFASLAVLCALVTSRTAASVPHRPAAEPDGDGSAPRPREMALWAVLAALPTVLLLAITAHLTQNVAAVPFLWVLPLALYLLSFILCFDGEGWYRRRWMAPLAAGASLLMLAGLVWRPIVGSDELFVGLVKDSMKATHAVPVYALGLFLVCMFCHGELAARKPAPAHLTRFFLMVSLGGAAGGLLVGIVAPLVYDWTWELPQALIAVCVLVAGLGLAARSRGLAGVGLACLVASVPVALSYRGEVRDGIIEVSRSFHGTLRVQAVGAEDELWAHRVLLHGDTRHGEQFLAPPFRTRPTSYYGAESGAGRALTSLRSLSSGEPQRVGVVGLGVGTMAAYARAGDHYRFYELDPRVVEVARKHFTYLSQSPAQVVTLLGDARLVLESEPAQQLDMMVVDAFSSDAIPVHLLTSEAMATYRRHARDDGAVAFHITNRYVDLSGVVRHLADIVGWTALLVVDVPDARSVRSRSTWVIVTGNEGLKRALLSGGAQEIPKATKAPWTDDRSNLFEVLK